MTATMPPPTPTLPPINTSSSYDSITPSAVGCHLGNVTCGNISHVLLHGSCTSLWQQCLLLQLLLHYLVNKAELEHCDCPLNARSAAREVCCLRSFVFQSRWTLTISPAPSHLWELLPLTEMTPRTKTSICRTKNS